MGLDWYICGAVTVKDVKETVLTRSNTDKCFFFLTLDVTATEVVFTL